MDFIKCAHFSGDNRSRKSCCTWQDSHTRARGDLGTVLLRRRHEGRGPQRCEPCSGLGPLCLTLCPLGPSPALQGFRAHLGRGRRGW